MHNPPANPPPKAPDHESATRPGLRRCSDPSWHPEPGRNLRILVCSFYHKVEVLAEVEAHVAEFALEWAHDFAEAEEVKAADYEGRVKATVDVRGGEDGTGGKESENVED